jgi:hypothetical protein
MKSSHDLDVWLAARATELASDGVTAVAGRGASMPGRPLATWISFETSSSSGRAVLWSTGRFEMDALSSSGERLCRTEREVTNAAELDDALTHLTEHLLGAARH